jgi:hypothetical protein
MHAAARAGLVVGWDVARGLNMVGGAPLCCVERELCRCRQSCTFAILASATLVAMDVKVSPTPPPCVFH